jgi:hypothetical protein
VMITAAAAKTGAEAGNDLQNPASDADFVSRYFAPAFGIDEDPVTGSAHCALAPYWAARLGQDRLTGIQLSARGGLVRVHHRGDRVELGGQAVTVLRSTLSQASDASEEGVAANRSPAHPSPTEDANDTEPANDRATAGGKGTASSDPTGSHG